MKDLDLRVLMDNYVESIKSIDKLYQNNLELKNRIEFAIEYIKNNNFYRVITYQEKDKGIVELDKNELLEILKGDSNE